MAQEIYPFYSDSGHGWLRVRSAELHALGLTHQISSCSYQHKEFVFLEEDDDLPKFFRAKGWTPSTPIPIRDIVQEPTPIRGYQPYHPPSSKTSHLPSSKHEEVDPAP